MAALSLACLRCGRFSPAGTRYCLNCGEPLDPALIKELNDLYHLLLTLDQRIAAGQGAVTLTALRDELRTTYETLRKQPPAAGVTGDRITAAPPLVCLRCGRFSPAGTRYCPNCGEPLDPALIKELNDLYHLLLTLDQRIAAGQGAVTLTALRDELRTTYETLRKQPPAAGVSMATAPVRDTAATTPAISVPATPRPTPARPRSTITGGVGAGMSQVAPAGPAFSWSAFIADQAIAIMAYLGGFLLLIAVLSFEIAGLPGLGDTAKLVVVVVVYLLFGILGTQLRRVARLRTVGGAYLGVFALLTPLVALAVYLFALRGLGLSVVGMLTIGAGYATCIYLVLVWRTRFATYGYLGWSALTVCALAAISWVNAPQEWWVGAFGAAALVMLSARLLAPQQRALGESALVVATLVSVAALLGEIVLALSIWNIAITPIFDRAATAIDTGVLMLLALLWGRYLRSRAWQNPAKRQGFVDLMDWLAAALAAQTVMSVAHWAQVDRPTQAVIMAALGVAEGAGAVATKQLKREGNMLRLGLEGLALALPTLGALTVFSAPDPNWALALALGFATVTTLLTSRLDHLPGWILVAGLFASLAYRVTVLGVLAVNATLLPDVHQRTLIFAASEFGFTLALVGVALALGFGATWRVERFMVHAVALGNALYVTNIMLRSLPQDHAFQLSVLAVFAATAYLAAVQQRAAAMTAAATFFGLVATAVLPSPNYVATLAITGGAAVAGAIVSRIFATRWGVALYALGIGASLFATARTTPFDQIHVAVSLLIFAAAAYILVVLERAPLAGIIPVLYVTGAVLAYPDSHFLLPLALTLSAMGLVIGRVGGPRWLWPPYAAEAVAIMGTMVHASVNLRFATFSLAALFVMVYVIVMAALGADEGVGAVATKQVKRERNTLRLGLEGLALALPTLGALFVFPAPDPNWALALALGFATVATLLARRLDHLPGWILVAGLFASLAYRVTVLGVLAVNATVLPDVHQRTLIFAASEFGFTLALVGIALMLGFGATWRVERFMMHAVALGNALYVTNIMLRSLPQDHALQLSVLAVFAAAAYLAAVQQRAAAMTAAATFFGLVATAVLPSPNYVATLAITGGAAVAGAIVSRIFATRWGVALYALGIGASLFATARTTPFDQIHVAVSLLIFAAAAYILAALERAPLAGIIPVLYATGAVLAHPDSHFLLPLALIVSAMGLVIGRVGGPRWLWPPYAAAAVAAVGTTVQSAGDLRFETLSLAAFFVTAYVIAAVEAQLEVLVSAFVIGAGALAVGSSWQHVASWQARLAFAALAFGYAALSYLWRVLPWLGTQETLRGAWWSTTPGTTVDARLTGVQLHRWAGLILAAGTALVACIGQGGFVSHLPETQAAVVILLALGAMLVWRSFDREAILARPRLLWYVAGECLALAITWEARWLGADNMQAFVLAPGSYHLIVGALLPVDDTLGRPVQLGRAASVLGSLLLLAPSLLQSFQTDPNWVYALALAAEAVIIVGIGVGTRTRMLVLIGSSFVGLAALRGAILAFQSGTVAVVIGLLAALLMGSATWLSLRARGQGTGQQPGTPTRS